MRHNDLLRKIANSIISLIKGTEYKIDPTINLLDLIQVCAHRLYMYLWSRIRYPLSKNNHRPLFLGRNSRIKHRNKVYFGTGCTIGNNVYIDALSTKGIRFGNNVTIPDNTFIRCTGVISDLGNGMTVGNNTGFGHFNFVNAQGGISIGNDVIIGPHVKILSENHNFLDAARLIREQGVTRKGIQIHDNVWIGAGVTILDGVTVHTGAVLAAGAVITKDVPEHSIAGGVPARIIGLTSGRDDQL